MMMRILLLAIIITTISLNQAAGQCFPDRHSTSVYDSWVSSEKKNNPNVIRGISHWILYDLGSTHYLGQTHFWNLNDPDRLSMGMQNYFIDVSSDGESWKSVGEFTLGQAPGMSIYEGEPGPDLGGEKANYLLITIKDTYGDGVMAGFSEMKIDLASAVLAINLLDFNVECSVQNVPSLEWSAIADSASEYFLLEQSTNGINWEELSEIPVTSVNQEETYTYNAADTEENYSYRLSSVDKAGNIQFLKLATTDCKKARSFEVWPNPFSVNANVQLNGFGQKDITYQLHDVLGRLAKSGKISVQSDEETFNISNDRLASGQYVLTIDDGFAKYKKSIIYLAPQ